MMNDERSCLDSSFIVHRSSFPMLAALGLVRLHVLLVKLAHDLAGPVQFDDFSRVNDRYQYTATADRRGDVRPGGAELAERLALAIDLQHSPRVEMADERVAVGQHPGIHAASLRIERDPVRLQLLAGPVQT